MATARAQQFIETVSHNPQLKQQLENASTREERRKIINDAGFSDVTKEDLLEAVKSASALSNVSHAEIDAVGELTDAELESVAGGETTLWLSAITVLAATPITAYTDEMV
jgi:predicted ribosomally synthesized peptide with nif11-like leader